MMYLDTPTLNDIVRHIVVHGERIAPRGAATIEMLGMSMRWPLGIFPTRDKLPKKLAAVEGVSLIAGKYSLEKILEAAPRVNPQLFEQSSKYAISISKQVPKIVKLLNRDPSTRRAILYFGRASDVGTSRTTCLTSLQFVIRDGHLHAILNMRSWDSAFGLPIDIIAVTILGLTIANHLALIPGNLTAQAGSIHIYDSSAHRAKSAAEPFGEVKLAESFQGKQWGEVTALASIALADKPWDWVTYS